MSFFEPDPRDWACFRSKLDQNAPNIENFLKCNQGAQGWTWVLYIQLFVYTYCLEYKCTDPHDHQYFKNKQSFSIWFLQAIPHRSLHKPLDFWSLESSSLPSLSFLLSVDIGKVVIHLKSETYVIKLDGRGPKTNFLISKHWNGGFRRCRFTVVLRIVLACTPPPAPSAGSSFLFLAVLLLP